MYSFVVVFVATTTTENEPIDTFFQAPTGSGQIDLTVTDDVVLTMP